MRTLAFIAAMLVATSLHADPPQKRVLRVCSDPNNLPYSNARREGFENKLAELVARDLNADVAYTWWPQRRGFLRNTLKAERCDVVMGVPKKLDMVETTRAYYRSGYVFVHAQSAPEIRSLDAPALHALRIGVPMVGDDGMNPPPVLALATRNLVSNMRSYSVYGDYSQEAPLGDLVRALRRNEIDVAIAWGPVAGYFAARPAPTLRVVPIPQSEAPAGLPFAFDIAMGVRHADKTLAAELDAVIARRMPQIRALLASYNVPTTTPHGD